MSLILQNVIAFYRTRMRTHSTRTSFRKGTYDQSHLVEKLQDFSLKTKTSCPMSLDQDQGSRPFCPRELHHWWSVVGRWQVSLTSTSQQTGAGWESLAIIMGSCLERMSHIIGTVTSQHSM